MAQTSERHAALPYRRRSARRPWAVLRAGLLLRLLVLLPLVALVAVLALRLYTVVTYRGAIFEPADVPARSTAIVFGAGVSADGEPTSVLYDRVAVAAELYHLGKADQILLSGDGRNDVLDEPQAMRRAALRLGVPDEALLLDGAGLRTYESCRRARDVFGVTDAVLVTQRFHLSRALMLCDSLNLDVVGVASDLRSYSWRWRANWQVRETGATVVGWLETKGLHPTRFVPGN